MHPEHKYIDEGLKGRRPGGGVEGGGGRGEGQGGGTGGIRETRLLKEEDLQESEPGGKLAGKREGS